MLLSSPIQDICIVCRLNLHQTCRDRCKAQKTCALRSNARSSLNRSPCASSGSLKLHAVRHWTTVKAANRKSVSSRELREGLRILGGSNTLSDIEHRALFRDISKGKDRVQYRELLDTLLKAEAAENKERTHRKLAHQAGLPTTGRGSANHWRHSDVLDWDVPSAGDGGNELSRVGLTRGRQHKESRREALVFERLRESVRRIQEQQKSAGPVFDMFHPRGRGQERGRKDSTTASSQGGRDNNDEHDRDLRTPQLLSPSALRAGLSSLGVPLGDRDFATLIATTDPKRRGDISYQSFCEALGLHQLRACEGGAATSSATRRPSSAPTRENNFSASGAVGGGGGGGGGEGYARRRARELAPPADPRTDLEGGVFHANPATYGCANPNFTTTMIPVSSMRKDGGKAPLAGTDEYRPKRRQSSSNIRKLLVVGGGDHVERWNETGFEAERCFRRGLGVKMRRSQSLCSCYAHGRGGWYNLGSPSFRGTAPLSTSSTTYLTTAGADNGVACNGPTMGALTGGSGNRRGHCYAPRNSDLGFGSERMRSQSKVADDRFDRDGRRGKHGGVGHELRRTRSLSVGAERRYGDWARSSVQYLLRQDGWLGMSSSHAVEPSRASEGYYSEYVGGTQEQQRRRAAVEARQQMAQSRSTPHGGALGRKLGRNNPGAKNNPRHPAQTTKRSATPYATDADNSAVATPWPVGAVRGVAGHTGNHFRRSHSCAAPSFRVSSPEPSGWGITVQGGGAEVGGQLSPTWRWDESTRSP